MTQNQNLGETLYCPTCGCILTGLAENRCPECKTALDPSRIFESTRSLPEMIRAPETLKRLALPGIVFSMILFMNLVVLQMPSFINAIGAMAIICWGVLNLFSVARPVVVARAIA